jgi:hypothetical protein
LCRALDGITGQRLRRGFWNRNSSRGSESYFFADDIVVFAQNEEELKAIWKKIMEWSEENEIKVNKAKSAVLELRIDQRTPTTRVSPIQGVPLEKTYKYLGIQIRDDGNMTPDLETRKGKDADMQKMKWILQTPKLNGAARYHLFTSLFRSKVAYGINLISIGDKKVNAWWEQYMYQALKLLLGIRDPVSKEQLFKHCLGQPFKEFFLKEQQTTIAKMANYALGARTSKRLDNIKEFCRTREFDMPELANGSYQIQKQELPIKEMMEKEVSYHLKWKLNAAFCMRKGELGRLRCPCGYEKPIT